MRIQIEIEVMAFHNAHEDYQKMNDQISLNLFQKQLNIRLYQTPHLAAFDITLAFQQYLSHKPNVGLCKNGSSLIESLTPGWLRTHTGVKLSIRLDPFLHNPTFGL